MGKKYPPKQEQLTQEAEDQGEQPDDEDPIALDGADNDNPKNVLEDDLHTSQLDKDFELILRLFFRIGKGSHHEVFEALHHHSVYSWKQFADIHIETICNLTKTTTSKKGTRAPVLEETKAKLKSFLMLVMKMLKVLIRDFCSDGVSQIMKKILKKLVMMQNYFFLMPSKKLLKIKSNVELIYQLMVRLEEKTISIINAVRLKGLILKLSPTRASGLEHLKLTFRPSSNLSVFVHLF